MKPPPVTVDQYKSWWSRRVDKPFPPGVSNSVLAKALDYANKLADLKYLHRQRHSKEK